jgi:hypothetical protein
MNFEEIINQFIATKDGWYSHRRTLVKELSKLDFTKEVNILEFGTGYGSAEVFAEYIKKYDNIKVTSFENNKDWFEEMKLKFSSPNYNFYFSEDWNKTFNSIEVNKKYDIVFVDQSPWEARISTIDFLTDKNAPIIILHDYDQYNRNNCNNCKAKRENRVYDFNKGSFFERFMENFIMEADRELSINNTNHPPTLILKNKKFL